MFMPDFLLMLQAVVEKAPAIRPFLCDGNPLTCTVAIVCADAGARPSFRPYWSDEKGMDRRSWMHADRALHTETIDGAQARLERFLPQISQRVIELTAPAKRINAGVDASEDYRVVDILQFILGVVAPRTVICVGAAAQRVVHSMDLSGSPAIIATREFIDWDTDYEHALAEEVNNPTAAATCGQRTRDAKSRGQTGSALRSWLAGLR